MDYTYIKNFENLAFGTFCHFGLYSLVGKGEWYKGYYNIDINEYRKLMAKFKVSKTWAKELVTTAKKAGAKYIILTTRHHDGFSLFDTCGLNDYDAPHSACKRDLVREFVDECNRQGIVPFLYHTLLDWYNKDFNEDFPKYLKYLRDSVKLLCTNYGKIGGFWFDGQWAKPNADWEEDALYGMIREYQPETMIINNTGLLELGKLGHKELDSVTFERGKPQYVDRSEKPIAGEMCQIPNDHWGNADNDFNYKSVGSLIEDLLDCRAAGCNFVLNIGMKPNGMVKPLEKNMFLVIGKWLKFNKDFIYNAKPTKDISSKDAKFLYDGKYYYAIIKDVGMSADPNVTINCNLGYVKVKTKKQIIDPVWLDNGSSVEINDGIIKVEPFILGYSGVVRIVKFKLK